ncbi:MAG: hypothetical protein OXI43_11650 [Candidatus Poribacteria bacterium]|nr:hypothetical protein [Candidatus Poribacteria bacterium]
MPHAHSANGIHTVDLAHSSLGILRLASREVHLSSAARFGNLAQAGTPALDKKTEFKINLHQSATINELRDYKRF